MSVTPTVIYRSVDGIISGSHPMRFPETEAYYARVAGRAEAYDDEETKGLFGRFASWVSNIGASIIIFSILLFIIVNFYIFASLVNFNKFFYIFLILSLLTDGLFIFIHLLRRETKHENVSFDPTKLTVVIASYNGEDVIGETIRQCLFHVPANQIVVVSDASTDDTARVARQYGVRVHVNEKNLHKAFSVNAGVELVTTPYTLLLDDDVLVGKATIPTSLLDEGYSAVAFNVMPVATESIVNHIQRFEYRNSMHIGKSLRGKSGAVGNVSGAIGLYRTRDLLEQGRLHSGQFAGEDEQRTLLAHIYGSGKGITYSQETVHTIAPSTFYALYRQRAYSWSLAVPELFTLYWRVILSPNYHFLLKAEKAYYLYIYLTDPLRLLFLWALIFKPRQLLMTYGFYLILNVLVWMKTRRNDHFIIILLYPFYTLWLGLCRFIGNFYWLKVKAGYLRKKIYRQVEGRRLLAEYSLVLVIFLAAWGVSIVHFASDVRLFNKISNYKVEDSTKSFAYESSNDDKPKITSLSNLKTINTPPANTGYVNVPVEKGDTVRAVAYKAIDALLSSRPDIAISYEARQKANVKLTAMLGEQGVYISPNAVALIDSTMVQQAVDEGIKA